MPETYWSLSTHRLSSGLSFQKLPVLESSIFGDGWIQRGSRYQGSSKERWVKAHLVKRIFSPESRTPSQSHLSPRTCIVLEWWSPTLIHSVFTLGLIVKPWLRHQSHCLRVKLSCRLQPPKSLFEQGFATFIILFFILLYVLIFKKLKVVH